MSTGKGKPTTKPQTKAAMSTATASSGPDTGWVARASNRPNTGAAGPDKERAAAAISRAWAWRASMVRSRVLGLDCTRRSRVANSCGGRARSRMARTSSSRSRSLRAKKDCDSRRAGTAASRSRSTAQMSLRSSGSAGWRAAAPLRPESPAATAWRSRSRPRSWAAFMATTGIPSRCARTSVSRARPSRSATSVMFMARTTGRPKRAASRAWTRERSGAAAEATRISRAGESFRRKSRVMRSSSEAGVRP